MELLFCVFLIVVGLVASKSSNNKKISNNRFIDYKKYKPEKFSNSWDEDFEGDGVNPNSEWGSIRIQCFKRDGYKCIKCGSNRNLTVNHKIPPRFGGKNKLNNLETLCKECHESLHNRKIFDSNYKFNDIDHYGNNVHLTGKVSCIANAIENNDTVEINYTDREGNETQRLIAPKIIFEEGKRIYVKSYCYLRKEDRTFRISRLSVVE